MKVAQLLPELNFGGVERGTVDLANFLVSQGHMLLLFPQVEFLRVTRHQGKSLQILFQRNPCLL